mmetsp:Transcript_12807/g.19396  ORF Transcript_12807/g.19396 Transcript_12807/m.19396 type:complete len:459 (-) Transcript_12807:109-1485(-)
MISVRHKARTKTDSASTSDFAVTTPTTERSGCPRETSTSYTQHGTITYKQQHNAKKRPRPSGGEEDEVEEKSCCNNTIIHNAKHFRVSSSSVNPLNIMSKEIATETESAGILFTSHEQHATSANTTTTEDNGRHLHNQVMTLGHAMKYQRQDGSGNSSMRRVHSTPAFSLLSALDDISSSSSCSGDDDHSCLSSDCHYDSVSTGTVTFCSMSEGHGSSNSLSQQDATTVSGSNHHSASLYHIAPPRNESDMHNKKEPPEMNAKNFPDSMSPHHMIQYAVRHNGFEPKELPALSLDDFFLEPTDEHLEAYDINVLNAVHDKDINALRKMLKDGKTLQCCNRFGESLIHMVCRRGFTEIAEFLIREAGVSVRVRDDCGRTPLHDACWAKTPAYELVELLIAEDPDLLLISDKRGHAPFEYARQEHYPYWRQFIHDRWVMFRPRPGARTTMAPLPIKEEEA